jgi:hypothetical protein
MNGYLFEHCLVEAAWVSAGCGLAALRPKVPVVAVGAVHGISQRHQHAEGSSRERGEGGMRRKGVKKKRR